MSARIVLDSKEEIQSNQDYVLKNKTTQNRLPNNPERSKDIKNNISTGNKIRGNPKSLFKNTTKVLHKINHDVKLNRKSGKLTKLIANEKNQVLLDIPSSKTTTKDFR